MNLIEKAFAVLFTTLLVCLSGTLVFDQNPQTNPGETVPVEIVTDAISSGGLEVMLFGNYNERHAFAKGHPTKFGKMSFNSDNRLKYTYGWSEILIHELGFYLGFSDLWRE